MIKDVSVTLTPLTDFEKEIEKSAKKVGVCLSTKFINQLRRNDN